LINATVVYFLADFREESIYNLLDPTGEGGV